MNQEAAADRASALLELARPREALEELTHAVAAAADDGRVHCLMAHGKWTEAEAAARHAIELDREDPYTHHSLGDVLFEQHRYALAAEAYAEALRLDPEDAGTLNNLALLMLPHRWDWWWPLRWRIRWWLF